MHTRSKVLRSLSIFFYVFHGFFFLFFLSRKLAHVVVVIRGRKEKDLMHFLPPLQILGADGRVVVEQRLAEHRVGLVYNAVVEGRQSFGVLVIGAGAELEQRLHRLQAVPLDGAVHRRQALLRSIVQQRAAVHQRYYHLRRLLQGRGQGQRSFCKFIKEI